MASTFSESDLKALTVVKLKVSPTPSQRTA
jgi:hypothetical protein